MYKPELHARVIYADPSTFQKGDFDIIVLKNIDPATEAGRIFIDLERLGYRVHSIRNAMNANTRRAAPIFFVELVKAPFNATVLGMKRIANQNVFIEKYFSNPELVRCSICQSLDHQTDDCSSFPICSWCNGKHPTRLCTNGPDFTPTCSCGGRHPSNYKGCHIYLKRIFEFKMGLLRKGSEMNVPPEDLIKLALEEESTVQSEGTASSFSSSVSSSDSRVSTDSEMEYPLFSKLSLTKNKIQLDYMKDVLKFTLDHYLSMHHEWRAKLLKT